jgi:toxin ParE1/3/4
VTSSSRRVTLTPEAESDLAGIIQYGVETWGEHQASHYAERIWERLAILAQFPELGRRRDRLSPGLHSHPAGAHLIFYGYTDDQLIVRRIAHSRQDIDALDW